MQNQLLKKIIITKDTSLKNAIEILNDTAVQILLVVNQNQSLIGTLSDGDIRRAILKEYDLSKKVSSVMSSSPLFVYQNTPIPKIKSIMLKNSVRHIPLVDKNLKILDLFISDNLINDNTQKYLIVIMAGGKGLRLKPYTEDCPKPMLKIGSKPILEHIIENAKSQGYKNFLISINYLGEIIKNYFKDGSEFGVNINYIEEKEFLGTVGGLSLIKPPLKDTFILMNGDLVANINYDHFVDFHNQHKASFTIALRYQELQNQFGVVTLKGSEVEDFQEKPVIKNYINAGLYVLEPEVLKNLKFNKYCDIPDLIHKVKTIPLKIVGFPIVENWLDIGRHEDYEKVKLNFDRL